MRQKAEQAIRRAAASVCDSDSYRLDKVRFGAGLHRKIFDKTILYMARLGTIHLNSANPEELYNVETRDLISKGDMVYISFTFADSEKVQIVPDPAGDSENEQIQPEPETIDTVLQGIDSAEWDMFDFNCKIRDGVKPVQKLQKMITDYNRGAEPVPVYQENTEDVFNPDMKEVKKLTANIERILEIGQSAAREAMDGDSEQKFPLAYWRYLIQDLRDIKGLLNIQ